MLSTEDRHVRHAVQGAIMELPLSQASIVLHQHLQMQS